MRKFVLLGAVAGAICGFTWSQGPAQATELKLAHFVPATHFMSKYLVRWTENLEKQSGGKLTFKIFPGSQMGPPPKYYDIARKGVADITWILHGATPGRFPLTELIQLPYMVPSAEVGTKVLNHPDIRAYTDKEHKGLKVLYLMTHQPGNLHTSSRPVRTIEDMKGLRIRFASPTIRLWVDALGGTPVGMPPTQIADGLQKGTIDGVFIDYGGAHTAFKLGGLIKYTTEMYSYVSSFAVVMNPRSFDGLPKDMQDLIVKTTTGISGEVGKLWDAADAPGRAYIKANGGETIVLSKAEDAKFKKIAQAVTEGRLKELEEKGLPARKVHARMQELSAEFAKTSKNFWSGLQRN
jgi:TRAP-type C4-dicarboxylate transport system substrate-binding protein